MAKAHYEREFKAAGKTFAALLDEQDDGKLSITVRLPDDSLRTAPGEYFDRRDKAIKAARSFAHEPLGS